MPKSTGQYLLFEPITKRKILRLRIDHLFSSNVSRRDQSMTINHRKPIDQLISIDNN